MHRETKKKYSELTYKLFEETFYALPIATLVTASQKPRELARRDTRLPINPFLSPEGYKRFFIVHGGLYSKDGVSLADVKKIDRIRQRQPGTAGLMSESLWADPQDLPGRGASKRVSAIPASLPTSSIRNAFCHLRASASASVPISLANSSNSMVSAESFGPMKSVKQATV